MNHANLSAAELIARLSEARRPRPNLDTPFVRGTTSVQSAIADCWAEVLSLEEVGLDDNLFSLGGDSLHMTQIAARVRGVLNAELSFEDFFTAPTIRHLASVAEERLATCA